MREREECVCVRERERVSEIQTIRNVDHLQFKHDTILLLSLSLSLYIYIYIYIVK